MITISNPTNNIPPSIPMIINITLNPLLYEKYKVKIMGEALRLIIPTETVVPLLGRDIV
jgi:hypothetical protein